MLVHMRSMYSGVGIATQYETNYRGYPFFRTPELGQSKVATSGTDNLFESLRLNFIISISDK